MFIHVKHNSKEEGMIAFTRAPLCRSNGPQLHCTRLRGVAAQTREPELIATALVNACLYQNISEAALRLYSHATSKTVKTPFIVCKTKCCICLVHVRIKPKFSERIRYTPNIDVLKKMTKNDKNTYKIFKTLTKM